MNSKTKANANSATKAINTVVSAGEILADGAMLELIAGSSQRNEPHLLLWDGSKATVGPRVEHRGCIYEAPALPPTLYRAIRLPSQSSDYRSVRSLSDEITDLFVDRLELPERESRLLACFSIGSWLADRLPTALGLVISGDEDLGIEVLRLLSCICRHPLMLAEITRSDFRALPMQLSPTLLLDQQWFRPNMQRLFRASSHRGLHLPGKRGSVVNLFGPKAIVCGDDAALNSLGGGMIHVAAPPSPLRSPVLDEEAQNEIANDYQPRLLMYRLKNASRMGESPADVSKLTSATRQLARTLAGCFPEDSGLANNAVQLLLPQDEEARGRRYLDVNSAIIEILWAILHDRKQSEVRVAELAQDVTTLLRSRGEILEYNAEEIGWRLRNLHIPRHTNSSGQQVLLGRDTSRSIHRLALAYDLPCAQRAENGCPDCRHGQTTVTK